FMCCFIASVAAADDTRLVVASRPCSRSTLFPYTTLFRSLVHVQHHRVAADTAADDRAVGDLGGAVVRAAGAEVRRAGRGQRQGDAGATPGGPVEPGPGGLDAVDRAESLGEPAGHGVHVELAEAAEQGRAVLVVLAHDVGDLGAAEVDLADHGLDE